MPQSISIYLCSDRDDMVAEREYLHREVFPKIQEWLTPQKIKLQIIDPNLDNPTSLDVKLAQIDQCRPHILALFGQSYGVEGELTQENLTKYDWLRPLVSQNPNLSDLHVELCHGILNSEWENPFALVMIRDDEFLNRLTDDNAKHKFIVSRPGFGSSRIPLLKAFVLNQCRSNAHFYPCDWDPQLAKVIRLESFGQIIFEQLKKHLERLINPIGYGSSLSVPQDDPSYRPMSGSLLDDVIKSTPGTLSQPNLSKDQIEYSLTEPGEQRFTMPSAPSTPTQLDENVQFTVYRPKVVAPEKWNDLLAFAHLSEKPPDAPADEPDPVQEVQRQAKQVLGEKAASYQSSTQDSLQAVPKRGEITFLPEVPGLEFNPPRSTFVWQESVHRQDFRFKADRELDGKTARGKLSIFHGVILLGDVPLTIKVDSNAAPQIRTLVETAQPMEAVPATRYRKIFASYSHKDLAIVEQFEAFAEAMGDEYLRDWKHLRAGERWQDKLMQMIREADVFQLFWSRNSMMSPFVRQEWEYALTLADARPSFVRPTYWEDPMPRSDAPPLPPPDLAELHFQRLSIPKGAPASAHTMSRDEWEAASSDSGLIMKRIDEDADLMLDEDAADSGLTLQRIDEDADLTLDEDAAPIEPDSQSSDLFETDFEVPVLDDDAASGSEVVSLDEDFDEAFDDASPAASSPAMPALPAPSAAPPPRASVPRRRQSDDFEDDFDKAPRASMARRGPRKEAPRSSGASEAIKIILGVIVLCALLLGAIILLTGRIPFFGKL